MGFTARDRTVFHAICCVWPLRWWSAGRVTPGRICSKSSLLLMGGPEPGSMLGDWSAPYSKAKYRKPSQRRRPCRTWSHTLLWSPLQNLSCFTAWINMSNFYLVKLLFCPFPLLSPLLLDELTVALLQMGRYERRSQNPFSRFYLSPFHSSPFSVFFLAQLAPSLPASRVNTSCALALLHRIKSTHLELALLPQMSALRLKWAPLLQRGWVKRKFQRGGREKLNRDARSFQFHKCSQSMA